jgi:flagellar hook-associated protein 2
MATITSLGVGSGLDLSSLITKLMAVERRPLDQLQKKQTAYETDLSAYGRLRSALSTFQTAMDGLSTVDSFKVYAATSSDEDVFTAAASSSAGTGNFTLLVNRIAESHKLGSANTFADSDTTTIGSAGQTMTLTVGTASFTVGYGGLTLSGIRDAINDASDNTGVTATVIRDDVGYRLLLTADETGSSDALSVSYSAADPFALATLNQDRNGSGGFTVADLDATMVLNGTYNITRSSNAVDDVIDGVTLTLKGAGTANLSVTRDTDAVMASAQAFADAYNSLRSTITGLRAGDLSGDNTLLLLESGLFGVLNSAPTGLTGSYSYLAQVGISIQKDGTMKVDTTDLETAISADFDGVAQLFGAANQGYAARLDALVGTYLQSDGIVDAAEDGINAKIDTLELRQDALEMRLEAIQKRYTLQFSALDTLLAQMQSTSNYLTLQLNALQSRN